MLVQARAKTVLRGRKLSFCVGDALRLPIPDASVDAVTVAFGVRNFADLDLGLAGLARVLRPGGALLVLEFSRPRGPLAPVLSWWVRSVPPRIGRWLSGDSEAYSYLPASVSSFPEGDEMCRALENAGFENIEVLRLTAGVASLYEGKRYI
jgi:demethylmenaquinone methyltransferase/2-methoxy-6-polyprenyl-1,4-benzoquinol methylase